jgi:hypothetical protein
MILFLVPFMTAALSLLGERQRLREVERVHGRVAARLLGESDASRPGLSLVLIDPDCYITVAGQNGPRLLRKSWRHDLDRYLEMTVLPEPWRNLLRLIAKLADKNGSRATYRAPAEKQHPFDFVYQSDNDLDVLHDLTCDWNDIPWEQRMIPRATALLASVVPGLRFDQAWSHARDGRTATRQKLIDPSLIEAFPELTDFLSRFSFPIWTDGEFVLVLEPWMFECLNYAPGLDEAACKAWGRSKDILEIARIFATEERTREEQYRIGRPLAELWLTVPKDCEYLLLQCSVYRVERDQRKDTRWLHRAAFPVGPLLEILGLEVGDYHRDCSIVKSRDGRWFEVRLEGWGEECVQPREGEYPRDVARDASNRLAREWKRQDFPSTGTIWTGDDEVWFLTWGVREISSKAAEEAREWLSDDWYVEL